MLNELNIIARGLLGLHGYPVDLPQRPAAAPASRGSVAAARVETRARTSTAAARPRPLTPNAQGSR